MADEAYDGEGRKDAATEQKFIPQTTPSQFIRPYGTGLLTTMASSPQQASGSLEVPLYILKLG